MIKQIKISIVLGSYNRKRFLKLCIKSIRKELQSFCSEYEIIVVDGGSSDGSIKWLIKQKDIIAIIQHNHGYWNGKKIIKKSWGYFMNLGFKLAKGKYICMLSDDCLVVPKSIKNAYELFEEKLKRNEKIGAIAFYWRNWPQNKFYIVGCLFKDYMYVNHGLFLNKAIADVNYIDEEKYFFYHADGDLAFKLWQKGYKIIDSPDSFVEHFNHANIKVRKMNLEKQNEDWLKLIKYWGMVFFNTENPEINGRLIKIEFEDSHKTARKFLLANPFFYIYYKLLQIFVKIKNLKV